jgi:predicted NACHT family NTPase
LKSIEVSQARTVARLLIEQLRSRNFILCFLGADSYGFVHRTFLEYFCASEFVERFGKRGLEGGLTLEELKTEVFGKHWQDESWHEVLRLITGMIDTSFAGEMIDYLTEQNGEKEKFRNLSLAAGCLLEVRNRTGITITATKLLNRIKDLNKYDLHYYYALYGDEVYEDEARLVGRIRAFVVLAVATTWKDDPDTLPWLQAQAHSNENQTVRVMAMQQLAEKWKDDPNTLLWFKSFAESEADVATRGAAMGLLAEKWKDDPNTLLWFKSFAESEADAVTRCLVMRELAKNWKDDPDILLWFKSHAQSNKDCLVRHTALKELAKGWKDDPSIIPILKTSAQDEDLSIVRCTAIQELTSIWKDEPGMFEFLCDRALNDPFERKQDWEDNPRQLALEAIIKQYPNHPQTLPLLQDRAKNDPDEKVREFAREKFEQLEGQN